MKNRRVLHFLAVTVLGAAPAFADKIPEAPLEQRDNAMDMRGLSMHDGTGVREFGRGRFEDVGFMARGHGFGRNSKFSIEGQAVKGNRDAEIDVDDSFDLGQVRGERSFERSANENFDKRDPLDVKHHASSFPSIVAPEPEAFTLVLLGVGVLGMLIYRRNS